MAELELKEPIASLDYTPWPGVGRAIWEEVRFENAGYSYVVSAGFLRPFDEEAYEDIPHRNFGGISVSFEGEVIQELDCVPATVDFTWSEDLWLAKRALGFQWDYVAREWVEMPD